MFGGCRGVSDNSVCSRDESCQLHPRTSTQRPGAETRSHNGEPVSDKLGPGTSRELGFSKGFKRSESQRPSPKASSSPIPGTFPKRSGYVCARGPQPPLDVTQFPRSRLQRKSLSPPIQRQGLFSGRKRCKTGGRFMDKVPRREAETKPGGDETPLAQSNLPRGLLTSENFHLPRATGTHRHPFLLSYLNFPKPVRCCFVLARSLPNPHAVITRHRPIP